MDPPRFSPYDFTRVPVTYNKAAPYRPYIRRTPDDPSVPCGEDVEPGFKLKAVYLEKLRIFFAEQNIMYTGWLDVAKRIPIPHIPDTPALPPYVSEESRWEDHLTRTRTSLQGFTRVVTDYLQYAYELGGFGRYLQHRCIDAIVESLGGTPPLYGVDDNMVGTMFEWPLPPDQTWVPELLDHGVPCFGVATNLGRREDVVPRRIVSAEEETVIAQLVEQIKAAPSTSRDILRKHMVRVRHSVEHVCRPAIWRTQPPGGYPGQSGVALPIVLLMRLFPRPREIAPDMLRSIRSVLGVGPFPLGLSEPPPPPSPSPIITALPVVESLHLAGHAASTVSLFLSSLCSSNRCLTCFL